MPAEADKKSVRTSVILPESTHARIQALADANDLSAAWVIRAAVTQFLERHEGEIQVPLKFPRPETGS